MCKECWGIYRIRVGFLIHEDTKVSIRINPALLYTRHYDLVFRFFPLPYSGKQEMIRGPQTFVNCL
jgi:hypothetical protein